MDARTCPRLVAIDCIPFEYAGTAYLRLGSRERLSEDWLLLRREMEPLLALLDGRTSIRQIRANLEERFPDRFGPGVIEPVFDLLDAHYMLDTARYRTRKLSVERQFLSSPIRPAHHAGRSYPDDPELLRKMLDGLFRAEEGAGLPNHDAAPGDQRLAAIFAPHIDYGRGGETYTWAFKELVEQSKADTFVLLGTSHYSFDRFIATAKDFETPLGVARTDQRFVQKLVDRVGDHLFHDELSHRPEHSLEFHVVFLQHLLRGRPFQIVPLLVGSFHDAVEAGMEPSQLPDVRAMAETLNALSKEYGSKVCFVISGDLAHLGMKFGDPFRCDETTAEECQSHDRMFLKAAVSGSAGEVDKVVRREQDRRRICGYPPLYLYLASSPNTKGRVLKHDLYLDPRGHEIVSFASLAFDAPA